MEREYPRITVTKKAEKAIRGGHPWVYADEVTDDPGGWADGDIADVVSQTGKWLGAGYANSHSKLRVRLLSRNGNDRFDEAFYRRRIHYAVEYRRQVMGTEFAACRLVFGEGNGENLADLNAISHRLILEKTRQDRSRHEKAMVALENSLSDLSEKFL